MEIGGDNLYFLDPNISIIENKLQTTVYSKPTDSHLYLHSKSCHNQASKSGISKGVALRLRKICSTDENFHQKSTEYTSYLTARGRDPKLVKKTFDSVALLPRESVRNTNKNRDINYKIVFSTAFNPRGPNVKKLVDDNLHLFENNPQLINLFSKGTILVANKRENNLKELLSRADPYSVKPDQHANGDTGYRKCVKPKCDSCTNFVDETSTITCHATGRIYKINRSSTCSTANVIYVAYCVTCGKQGVGSTVSWKPRLANYKSHIKKKLATCRIVQHFTHNCNDEFFSNLRFIIVDVVNNVELLTLQEIDTLLLAKEKFWIGTLVTQHKGLNGTHHWRRSKRSDREKLI